LEKRDAEAYTRLQAGHDLQLAGARLEMHDLRLNEADGSIQLAELQQERAQFQKDTFQSWIDNGLNKNEKLVIKKHLEASEWREKLSVVEASLSATQAAVSAAGGGLLGSGIGAAWAGASAITLLSGLRAGISNTISSAETSIQINSLEASFERRKEEWELQKGLAEKDIEIGRQQVLLAEINKRIVEQEHEIANLQVDQAKLVADFLANKFTNAELYEWMSGILGRIYSYFLQQATAMAQLAQSQLAFERQEMPPALIKADYWQPPAEADHYVASGNEEPDRRGMTGSARLLQDIYRLDQHAFETRKRKLQLAQTFSLASLSPFEFEQFRETGVLPFATPMELFDQDFPGHYLRLIKRFRLSIVALIPPNRGVRASLKNSGLSRVVTAGEVSKDAFQTVVVRRDPEQIAFTSPIDATGMFELQSDAELLLPFEGMGVDTSWELELPKAANPFDYRNIADVLVTIEYTALDSATHREKVIRELNRSVSAERSFSFRQNFVDSFYHLSNSEYSNAPMVVNFETRREDFPPNINELAIQHIVMFFSEGKKKGSSIEVPVSHLHFTEHGTAATIGGSATTMDRVISTRRANAQSWADMIGRTPVGTWELAFPNTEKVRSLFAKGQIEDILFVITYSGRTPAWIS
ncbi:MAG: hypothetical protein OEY77_16445, partial [Nitrospira sp.]|nr:hypothetical protein [Nitrospira sp.]